jgi:hypothetical protein
MSRTNAFLESHSPLQELHSQDPKPNPVSPQDTVRMGEEEISALLALFALLDRWDRNQEGERP